MKKAFKIMVYIFAAIGFILVLGYIAIRLHLTNTPGIIDLDQSRYLSVSTGTVPNVDTSWANTPEWQSFKTAVVKDTPMLNGIEGTTGVSSRLIVSILGVEQLRLYNDDRESFKKFFEPLSILGSQSIYSLGLLGIKEETAIAVENNLKDSSSPFYPGPSYEHLLDFQTASSSTERISRLVDQHNHYFSYLYAALYIKEVEAEWKKAGFDISNRPAVLATLYNIGFDHSLPNANPQVGGAAINIRGVTYSFGGLAFDIYYSNELLESFPRE